MRKSPFNSVASVVYECTGILPYTHIYSPRSLAGENTIEGVRDRIAAIFDISASHTSNLMRDVAFFYQKYTRFRECSDLVLDAIRLRIEKRILELIQR